MHRSLALAIVVATGIVLAARVRAQDAQTAHPVVGAWTLNKDLSDPVPDRSAGDGQRGDGGYRGGGRRGGGGGVGGGFGGGRFGGGFGGGRVGGGADPDQMRRRMQALRDIMEAPDRLTITESDATVIVTTGDGRVTRLATNGKKVKDDSTGIERKTHWDGRTLVSEINGAGQGKITETYSVDPEQHRLTVTLHSDNSRLPNGGTVRRVYDAS
jgi:hypothetical protein